MGDVEKSFKAAEEDLGGNIELIKKSAMHKTAAWGMQNAPDFLNQAWEIRTSLAPHALLKKLLQIESRLGRIRQEEREGYQNRSIDIDILFFEDLIINDENLKIPHPRLNERLFALLPLAEIAASFLHPLEQKSVEHLLRICRETHSEVEAR